MNSFVFCAFLFTVGLVTVDSHDSYSSVLAEQLNQYCELRGRPDGASHRHRIGKAGPRGVPGPVGSPGIVNYTLVEEIVERRLGEINVQERLTSMADRISSLEEALTKSTIKDCSRVTKDFAKITNLTGGVFDIYPGYSGRPLEVFCDLTTDGGGWTVFQRRMDGSENFERNWADYVAGFGSPDKEFWMGLEKISDLLSKGSFELRVDLEDWDGSKAYAHYSSFAIGDASNSYQLTAGGYSGTAGDSLTYHSGQRFYTVDQDTSGNCARSFRGAWWYKTCHYSNLNGVYINGGKYPSSTPYGVEWYHWRSSYGHSMKFTEMKFRHKI